MPKTPRSSPAGFKQALDELRFGSERTLNLRATLPTVDQALARAESWLRQQQVRGHKEVLVITGRGRGSEGGVSVVREAIAKLLRSLTRRGVVAAHAEHTAGSYVVTLAPMRALFEAPKRRREPTPPPVAPPSLSALSDATRDRLRALAERALEVLGVHATPSLLESEMLRQFGILAPALAGPDAERRLKAAIERALQEYDEIA